ncbi:uncharacterized protein LOC143300577 [Babylonia areolata]|uniref:uncharacterized protein LOC143300577 n=1 Tax=Babylonia areolata TaxID=304850 RepID=UPI003FCEEFCB
MSLMIRPDSGTKSRAASQRDVNKHINELQQELNRSRAETQRSRDKLNCLISLVRRSWNGDRNASIHLANIIGLDIPPFLLDSGTAGRPGTSMQASGTSAKSAAVAHWERLSVKLLRRDYDLMQMEIQEQQRRYMENRSRFMDEVLHFHQQDMASVPRSRPTSGKLSSVDHQFLQMHSMVRNDGKNEIRSRLNRPKSSIVRTRPKVERDVVQQAEVKLRDLFVDSTSPPTMPSAAVHPAAEAYLAGSKEAEPLRQKCVRQHQDYDDSRRYMQGQLFRVDEVLGKKPRPMSAAVLREKDRMRARPKSAVTITMEGPDGRSGERPLKYETTRPVSGKRGSSARTRQTSASSTDAMPQFNSNLNANCADDSTHHHQNDASFADQTFDDLEDGEAEAELSQPPISVRVKNAVARPGSIDQFSQDLQAMEQMEAVFKMNTLALQKKLGLPDSGMV